MAFGSAGLRQFTAAACVSMAVLVVGTALGWPSPVIYAIKNEGVPMNMTNGEISIMVSLMYFGNMVSPIPSGMFMDLIGRKMTLQILSVVPMTTWVLVYFAKTPMMLYIARFLVGTWLGIVGTVVPMYVAEISEPKIRGALSTFFQLMTNVGVLFVFLIGSKVDYYSLTYIVGSIPVIFACALVFMPESPYWQVRQGKHEAAVKSLRWLRVKNREEVKREIEEIEATVTGNIKRSGSYLELFRTRGNRKAFLMVQVLSATQRASGISALMVYTSTTLPNGIGSLSVNDCVTVMGSVLVISVLVSTFLVDKAGRRPLLLVSSVGSGISMFLAGLWFFLDTETGVEVQEYHWVPFACFLSYSVFFCIGLGPIPTTIQGEAFPSNIKGLASGLTTIVLALTSFIMNLIYTVIADSFGMYLNYWIFATSCTVAALFVIFGVVETKGRSLFQIQQDLNEKKPTRPRNFGSQPL